jgi:hypothetical protein
MPTLKCLTICAALIVGGTSLAIAQNGPATGGQPPAGVRAGAPGPYLQSAAPPAQATAVRHHKKMSTKHHKHAY